MTVRKLAAHSFLLLATHALCTVAVAQTVVPDAALKVAKDYVALIYDGRREDISVTPLMADGLFAKVQTSTVTHVCDITLKKAANVNPDGWVVQQPDCKSVKR